MIEHRIAMGIAQWLSNDAPDAVKEAMNGKHCEALVRAICDQFTEADFERK